MNSFLGRETGSMLSITRRRLEQAMGSAKTYDEWRDMAESYDRAYGLDRWRQREATRRYDYVSIGARHDDHGLLYMLNEGIHGNMDGIGSPVLYNRARVGTKQLVCDYTEELASALVHLASSEDNDISPNEKREFFSRLRFSMSITLQVQCQTASISI